MRDVFEPVRHEAADRFAVVVRKVGSEEFIELLDGRQRLHAPAAPVGNDVGALILAVEFVGDVAHDEFEHVFDRDETRDAPELVDDERHVAARLAEVPEEDVHGLALRNEAGGAQARPHVGLRIDEELQEVLRVKNPRNVVEVALVGGKAGVPRTNDRLQPDGGIVGHVHAENLRARDHDVVRAQFGNVEGAFHHGERVLVDETVVAGFAQRLSERGAVVHLIVVECGRQAVEKTSGLGTGGFVRHVEKRKGRDPLGYTDPTAQS